MSIYKTTGSLWKFPIVLYEGEHIGICDKTIRKHFDFRNGTPHLYTKIITLNNSNYKTLENRQIHKYPLIVKNWREFDLYYVKMGYIHATPTIKNCKYPTINISIREPSIAELFVEEKDDNDICENNNDNVSNIANIHNICKLVESNINDSHIVI
jgi:hypothetical protein